MAHQAEPVTRTLTQKTKPISAAAKMPIQFSPLLPVWMKPKSVEVTQAACQKPAPSALFQVQQQAGKSPSRAIGIDAPDAVALGRQRQNTQAIVRRRCPAPTRS
jgi:hypothetical protein